MNLKLPLLSLILLAFLASCHISNDVTNGRMIQKRKYNNGFYFNFGKNAGGDCDQAAIKNDNDATTEVTTEPIGVVEETTAAVEAPVAASPEAGTPELAVEIPVGDISIPPCILPAESDQDITGVLSAPVYTDTKSSGDMKIGRTYKPAKIQTVLAEAKASDEALLILILLIILCFIIPPVSVAVVDGIGTRFIIDLILFLIGIGVGWWLFGGALAYLCLLFSVIYALLIVLEVI